MLKNEENEFQKKIWRKNLQTFTVLILDQETRREKAENRQIRGECSTFYPSPSFTFGGSILHLLGNFRVLQGFFGVFRGFTGLRMTQKPGEGW